MLNENYTVPGGFPVLHSQHNAVSSTVRVNHLISSLIIAKPAAGKHTMTKECLHDHFLHSTTLLSVPRVLTLKQV